MRPIRDSLKPGLIFLRRYVIIGHEAL